MNKAILLTCCLVATLTHAETAPAPVKPQAPKPTAPAPVTAPKPVTAQKPVTPAVPATPAIAPTPLSAQAPQQGPAMATAQPPAPAPLTPEQRRQQELLANAERIDKANRELLAKNQELQLQYENLTMQVNVIKRDKSSEGIWKGALAVVVGFIMGWYFSGSGRRKSSW